MYWFLDSTAIHFYNIKSLCFCDFQANKEVQQFNGFLPKSSQYLHLFNRVAETFFDFSKKTFGFKSTNLCKISIIRLIAKINKLVYYIYISYKTYLILIFLKYKYICFWFLWVCFSKCIKVYRWKKDTLHIYVLWFSSACFKLRKAWSW